MKLLVIVVVIITAWVATRPEYEQVRVARVIDGDTLVLEDGRKVRLLQINAPERGECGYQEAKDELSKLVGHEIGLERDERFGDTDQYGRLLRYVIADGAVVNVQLQKQGLVDTMLFEGKQGKYAYQMDGHGSCAS